MKEVRRLDVVLISATGLKKVNKSKMAAYVVAWIEPSVRVPGPMDKSNGTNPVWNSTISIAISERTFSNGMYLNLELLGMGILSTKPIGSVCVDVGDLLSEGSKGVAAEAQFHDCPVTRRSGRQQGSISFEIHLRESPTLLKVHDMIPTEPPSKASGGYYEPSAPPETQPQSQPQQQGLGSYERASWKASRKTAAQEKQYSPPTVASNPVPRNRVYAFQSPKPRTESKSLLSSFS